MTNDDRPASKAQHESFKWKLKPLPTPPCFGLYITWHDSETMQASLLQSAFFSWFLQIDKSYSFASLETAINQCLDKHSAVRDWAHWRWSESMKWKDTSDGHNAHVSRKLHEIKSRNEMLVDEGNWGRLLCYCTYTKWLLNHTEITLCFLVKQRPKGQCNTCVPIRVDLQYFKPSCTHIQKNQVYYQLGLFFLSDCYLCF